MSGLSCACGRPAPGATLCRACTAELAGLLGRCANLALDLDVALSRQARVAVAGPGGGGGDEQPLPFSVAASDALRSLRTLLAAWVPAVVSAGNLAPATGGSATAAVAENAQTLAGHLETLRQDQDAQAFLDGLHHAVARATEVIDHPAVVVWVGVCRVPLAFDPTGITRCPGDLYANTDDVSVRCRACGFEHDAQARRVELLSAAREHNLTAAQAARAVKAYGVTTTPSRVRFMASDGVLSPAGADPTGHPTYRLGDVLDALRRPAAPRHRREASR